jgi:hypothetical protein
MTIEELREVYHSGTIPIQGKTEIQRDFIREFGYASNQQFIQKMKLGGTMLPTPKQFAWLKERVLEAHDYYTENQIPA